ncbi:MAG: 23S rRNA (pseudouridine(1915)-N(3))-methyltransferase RlmH [Alphaproteobacteria bacterium]|nr:23S rRNA (pseudouridine(1915)-N(3))-methyltransferase RlmH [Alphaproteobacteria bacterium]
MNIVIAAVGRMRSSPEQTLIDSYIKRLPWAVDVREVDVRGKTDATAQARQEAEGLQAAIPAGAKVVCLDSRGKSLDSESFAKRLGQWRDDGEQTLALIIGGADGLDSSIIDRADLVMSFGAVTWPHMLTRVLVAEQLYRAHCILTGHPYHRGH